MVHTSSPSTQTLKQEDHYKCESSLVYTLHPRPGRAKTLSKGPGVSQNLRILHIEMKSLMEKFED